MISTLLASLCALGQADPLPISVTLQDKDQRVLVQAGGSEFTALNHAKDGMPYLYPVVGPEGAWLTRGYPMDPRPGETKDHPHHRSMWMAHGAVEGYDFWHSGPAGERIVLEEVLETRSGEIGLVRARYSWVMSLLVCASFAWATLATSGAPTCATDPAPTSGQWPTRVSFSNTFNPYAVP